MKLWTNRLTNRVTALHKTFEGSQHEKLILVLEDIADALPLCERTKLRKGDFNLGKYEIPYVEKMTISQLVIGNVGKEAEALRATLEYFDYRVDTHLIGSKQEVLKIMRCEITTHDLVIICCHGDEKGILMDGEPQLVFSEIEQNCKMEGKTVISTGCLTGTKLMADSYISSGVLNYIAPRDYIDANSSLMFLYQLFFSLHNQLPIEEAIEKAKSFDQEANHYNLFSKLG